MNILLDTHILLWALYETRKLKKKHFDLIKNINNDIFVSAISIWEISLKHALDKLYFERLDTSKILQAIDASGFTTINMTPRDAVDYYNLPRLTHRDPFDRMLICQAIQNDFELMSTDKVLLEYKNYGLKII